MADPEKKKCAVCGLVRSVTDMIQQSDAPVSKSGVRIYRPIWYCKDKNHNLPFVARMAAKKRP